MATVKQQLAFKKTMENNGNVSRSMREAGYSRNHAKNPQSLINSKGFQEMLEKYISKKRIIEKIDKMMNQGELVQKVFPADLDNEIIKKIFKDANIPILYLLGPTSGNPAISVYYLKPDTFSQDKAVEKTIKLYGLYEPEKYEIKQSFSLVKLFNKSILKK